MQMQNHCNHENRQYYNQNWNQTVYSFLWDGILVMHEYS